MLIPTSNLEDFPVGGDSGAARSLLAAWTTGWHPALIVGCGGCPKWYRADSPPLSEGKRLFFVPEQCLDQVPLSLNLVPVADAIVAGKGSAAIDVAGRVTGRDREAMLSSLGLQPSMGRSGADESTSPESRSAVAPLGSEFPWGRFPASLENGERTITVADFFALAYASLQIQIMTRRLRYSSNLDEIQLHNHAFSAATAFVAGNGESAVNSLHDAFDLLSEERDHYFASDPSLVDLSLVTAETLDRLAPEQFPVSTGDTRAMVDDPASSSSTQEIASEHAVRPDNSIDPSLGLESDDEADDQHELASRSWGVLPRVGNLLLDSAACAALGLENASKDYGWLIQALAEKKIGWAGGGPSGICFDEHSFSESQQFLTDAFDQAVQTIGVAPTVYARQSGSTPSDLMSTIAGLGYRGVIPLDFERGTGYGDEAKVVIQTGTGELEALTARPIDATCDASFLNLMSKLGESIDSGEIATALLVHWPGQSCDSFDDLRLAAAWSLALGKFWRLDEYFTDGEHPYHHGDPSTLGSDAAEAFETRVASGVLDPVSSLAATVRRSVLRESTSRLDALAGLAAGGPGEWTEIDPIQDQTEDPEAVAMAAYHAAGSRLGQALGLTLSVGTADSSNAASTVNKNDHPSAAKLVTNPYSNGDRQSIRLSGPVSKNTGDSKTPDELKQLYAQSHETATIDNRRLGFSATTVDTPGHGFSITRAGTTGGGGSGKLKIGGGGWLGKRLFGDKMIANGNELSNEFMEVKIQASTGGIGSVFSGSTRGNRCSSRLVLVKNGKLSADCQMVAERLQIVQNGKDAATIRTTGRLLIPGEMSASTTRNDDRTAASFEIDYTLRRGSRALEMAGELQIPSRDGETCCVGNPWKNYVAVRVASATEASIDRLIVRGKLHRTSRRRMVSPMGLVIDEADRQTLIASDGRAYHRRASDRFVDTILHCQGERDPRFRLAYGFDISSPVAKI
ncbi:MAG: hypothetical protein AAF989_10125 [Planctomycetota bacterium]